MHMPNNPINFCRILDCINPGTSDIKGDKIACLLDVVIFVACFGCSFCAVFTFGVSWWCLICSVPGLSYVLRLAEWPPFVKELVMRLTMFSLCIVYICNFGYFPFWFRGRDFGSCCGSSWSLLAALLLLK